MSQPSGRVLIVDDDPDYLEQMKMYLQSRGYEVHSASSRPEGEKILEEIAPDIAVLDLMMENEDDGFVLSYRIKRKYPSTPVILVTAVTHETGLEFDETEEQRGEHGKPMGGQPTASVPKGNPAPRRPRL